MVIYIDVLFMLNLIINYFILLAVSQLLHRRDKRLRILVGAALGALYASLMFFPQLSFLYTALLKLVFSVTIVAVSFRCHGLKSLLKLLTFFYITSMLFGGIIYALEYFLAPTSLVVKNGVAYMDISPLFLILSGAGCYIVIKVFSRHLHRDVHTEDIYVAKIEVEGNSVTLSALLDNGNDLCDAISGSPVVIAEFASVEPLIPAELRIVFKTGKIADVTELNTATERSSAGFDRRFRVVPYGSVGNTGGILPAFRPDMITVATSGVATSGVATSNASTSNVSISHVETSDVVTSNVLIAVTNKRLSDDGLFSVLLNPRLLGRI